MDDRIILDRESFKALAAETRVKILKLLYSRRQMQTELAASLSLALPSVKEHLDALVKAGLVSRKDEGRKWKYYELTAKGKAVLDPEQKRIWIVLSLFVVSVAGGLAAYARTLLAPLYSPAVDTMALKAAAPAAEAMDTGAALAATTAQTAPSGIPWAIIIYCAWLVILLIILIYSYYQRKKYIGDALTKS